MNLTFSNIYNPGVIEKESNDFSHLAFMEVPELYDGNFIKWKEMPALETLKQVENYMKETHLSRGQNHVKFIFPQDEKISEVLVEYLTEQQYDIGFLEMYAINPKSFASDGSGTAQVQFISKETLQAYCTIHYEEAKQWGESYALSKRELLKKIFVTNENSRLLHLWTVR